MGIQNDLSKGKEGEQAVITCFKKHSIDVNFNTKKNSIEYDLLFSYNGRVYTIEVKYDVMAAQTGNLAIEYFNCRSNKPSGIMATKSNFWACILSDGSVWICRTSELLSFTKTAKPVRVIGKGGDGNASLLLYNKDHILSIFNRMDNIDNQTFITTLEKEIAQL